MPDAIASCSWPVCRSHYAVGDAMAEAYAMVHPVAQGGQTRTRSHWYAHLARAAGAADRVAAAIAPIAID